MKKQNIYEKIETALDYENEVIGSNLNPDFNKIIADTTSEEQPMEKKLEEVESYIKKIDTPIVKKEKIDEFSEYNSNWQGSKSLDVLYDNIHSCMKCELGKTRNQFVFGTGNPNAKIMIIGEAPGADEDEQGKPFVGRAGKLLTKIIEAIDFKREDVFIANIIKCRPPKNRKPEAEEVEHCEPYLQKQIELINPEFILALGLTAIDTLLKKKHVMKDSRGQMYEYHGRKLMVTYHPAALLRNPSWKKFVWEDVKHLKKLYDEYMLTEPNKN